MHYRCVELTGKYIYIKSPATCFSFSVQEIKKMIQMIISSLKEYLHTTELSKDIWCQLELSPIYSIHTNIYKYIYIVILYIYLENIYLIVLLYSTIYTIYLKNKKHSLFDASRSIAKCSVCECVCVCMYVCVCNRIRYTQLYLCIRNAKCKKLKLRWTSFV